MSVTFDPGSKKNINNPGSSVANRSNELSETLSFIKSITIFFAIALTLRASVVEAFRIPSGSMEPTLEIGDHLLVNKLSYGLRLPLVSETVFDYDSPERGDIVVFTRPDDPRTSDQDESDTNIIKRVVGIAGDEVEVRGTYLYINGQRQDEDYARWQNGGAHNFSKLKVPEGNIFLLGDNRDLSKDSRFWSPPYLETSRVKGRAFIIFWNSSFSFKRMFNIIR